MAVAGETVAPEPPVPAVSSDAGPQPRARPTGGGAGERVLALVGPDPDGELVVRRAKRLADALAVPWIALHVERPGRSEDAGAALEIAAQLGAEIEVRAARSLEQGVLAFAASRDIAAVVIGEARRRRLAALRRRSAAARLIRRRTGLTIHVVALAEARPRRRDGLARLTGGYAPLISATALVAVVIAVGEVFRDWLHPEALGMMFLAAVVGAAASYGLAVALYASLLGFVSWIVLFIPPIDSLTIYKTRDVLAVFVFVGIAGATGWLASRVRAEARTARGRLDNLRRILVFSRKLGEPIAHDHLLEEVARQASLVAGEAIVLTMESGALAIRAASRGAAPTLDASSWAAARWACSSREQAGRGTAMLPAAPWLFLPLRTVRDLHGVLGVLSEAALHEPQLQALAALADQAAAALERVRLAAAAARSEAQAETQKLRTALLNSLSHDLRTPLTSIRGAAGSLRTAWDRLPPAVRSDLLASIEEDTIRMTRFLANITEMTRLESGQIAPRRERVSIGETIDEALGRIPGIGPVRLEMPEDLPPVRADGVLLEQVLVNVLENARKYSPSARLIRVRASAADERVVIGVADEGVGIAPADLPYVFDSFYRARRQDRTVPGTGLGLAIARGLMDAMGGTIEAVSPRPDAPASGPPGTVVELSLAVAA